MECLQAGLSVQRGARCPALQDHALPSLWKLHAPERCIVGSPRRGCVCWPPLSAVFHWPWLPTGGVKPVPHPLLTLTGHWRGQGGASWESRSSGRSQGCSRHELAQSPHWVEAGRVQERDESKRIPGGASDPCPMLLIVSS